MRRFENKVALVTGAASGIGRATVERLAQEGARVFCVDVQAEAVEATAAQARELGGEAAAHVCDVSDPAQCEATVQACVDRFGRLDCVCNIAGILRLDHAIELSLENWNRVLGINLTGTFLMCKAALPHLLETGGTIVNTASTAALAGLPWGAAYAASKGGVLALTKALAVEYGRRGVRVNAVSPGSVLTPMGSRSNLPKDIDDSLIQRLLPLDKPRGPETVAGVIAMLASDDGAHIIGEQIRVDGGMLS
jgi:meso-butanediol dehydrogenase/(S,S)-butanediol dehydrogenase/diacetyl reductase